jgi:hypothetical protein
MVEGGASLLGASFDFFPQLSTNNHQLPQMASVAGLAPARASLKGWWLELLCIHGRSKKFQAPKSKFPRSSKLQNSGDVRAPFFKIGTWNFSGA